jgi:hypothetical protein
MHTAVVTVMLTVIAAITAGFWLTIVMWLPGNVISAVVRDPYNAFGIMQPLSMIVGAGAVFAFGVVVLGLPWVAAAVAGAIVGMTTYARPNPESRP